MTASAGVTGMAATWRRRFEVVARLIRVFSMGATILYVVVGAATPLGEPSAALLAGAVCIGTAFHVYADVGNDVMDLPLDRTNSRRAPWPLVQGTVSPQQALLAVTVGVTAAYGVAAWLGASPVATGALSAAVVLIAVYNLFGKRVPFAGDLVQAAGWAALVALGAELGGGATVATVWAMVFVVAYVAMVNGVHGALRDVGSDTAGGARTTAIVLGAGETAAGGWSVPPPLTVYCVVLQVTAWVSLGGLLVALDVTGWRFVVTLGVLVVGQTVVAATLLGAHRARGEPSRAMAFGTWHLFLLPAGLLVVTAGRLPWWAAAVAAAAFVLPPLIFGWAVSGSDPRPEVPPSPDGPVPAPGAARWRAIVRMCRPLVCLAAAGLTTVGAVLAGALVPQVLAAAVAATVIVAASNVLNDRCDVAADQVNRPDRALPTGRLTGHDADRAVLALGVAGVAVASLLGAAAAAGAAALLALGMAYSAVLRSSLLLAPITVAAVFAATIPYGGLFAGRSLGAVHVVAGVQVFLFVLTREALKSVPDREGDAVAGYVTVATRHGGDTALRLFRTGAAAYTATTVLPLALGLGGPRYLVAMLLLGVGPVAVAVWRLRDDASDGSVRSALAVTSVVLVTGLVPLTMLSQVS